MRQTILLGLEQAYDNLVHMISDFLPRLVVMLIIIAIGLLIALLLKYRFARRSGAYEDSIEFPRRRGLRAFFGSHISLRCRSLLRPLDVLDNLVRICVDWAQRAECCRSAGANCAVVSVPARSVHRDIDFVSGIDDGELFVPRRAACLGKCGTSVAANP